MGIAWKRRQLVNAHVRQAAVTLGGVVVAVMSAAGCRATSVGLVIAAVGDTVTEIDARHYQKELQSRPAGQADRAFESRRRIATWHDRLSQDRFLRFQLPRLGKLESFYAVRVTPAGGIIDVNRWIEWSDGFEDTLKLAFMTPKVLGKTQAQAEADARLKEPVFVFGRKGRPGELRVYDVTNFTHLRPRFLILEFDQAGICREAQYYGIAGGARLRVRREGAPDSG